MTTHPVADDDSLLETVDIVSRPDEVQAIRVGMNDLDAGDVLSADQVCAAMVAAGRLTA